MLNIISLSLSHTHTIRKLTHEYASLITKQIFCYECQTQTRPIRSCANKVLACKLPADIPVVFIRFAVTD